MTDNTLVIPALKPVYVSLSGFSEALLRVAAGGFLVPHGAQKLFGAFGGFGLEATGQYFQTQLGFANGYLAAFGAGSVEVFGGLLLALGLFTRFAAGAVAAFAGRTAPDASSNPSPRVAERNRICRIVIFVLL